MLDSAGEQAIKNQNCKGANLDERVLGSGPASLGIENPGSVQQSSPR